MAGANLTDDMALQATVLAGLFRAQVASGGLSRVPPALPGEAAAAAGLSETQARLFISGRLVLPPHQSSVFIAAILEGLRALDVARADSLRSDRPPAPESAPELVEAAGAQLRRDFPSWNIALPAGYEKIGGNEPVALVWRAVRAGSMKEETGVSAAELGSKMRMVEAKDAKDKKDHRRYMEG
jgi:hypothetical protein